MTQTKFAKEKFGFASGRYLHIVTRMRYEVPVKGRAQIYEVILHCLNRAKQSYSVDLYAFCILPERTEIICRAEIPGDLSLFMKTFKQTSASWCNRIYQRRGAVWQKRFSRTEIGSLKDFHSLVKKIEFYPVREKRSPSPMLYPYSSFTHRILGHTHFVDRLPSMSLR